ncbi:Cro/CI family transcriptional regulator [Leptospirillum ferriphilum]|jgi:transposase-like protein|uniref:Cro/CI family transcriptional regulator n=1 Tax=Leptospirillum ferriphilum TaxID=178606 RepID=UPI000317712E
MKKNDAIRAFGSVSELARAIGITPQAISQWPDELTPAMKDRVIAALVRTGRSLSLIAS